MVPFFKALNRMPFVIEAYSSLLILVQELNDQFFSRRINS